MRFLDLLQNSLIYRITGRRRQKEEQHRKAFAEQERPRWFTRAPRECKQGQWHLANKQFFYCLFFKKKKTIKIFRLYYMNGKNLFFETKRDVYNWMGGVICENDKFNCWIYDIGFFLQARIGFTSHEKSATKVRFIISSRQWKKRRKKRTFKNYPLLSFSRPHNEQRRKNRV